jgi:hypothetical protein
MNSLPGRVPGELVSMRSPAPCHSRRSPDITPSLIVGQLRASRFFPDRAFVVSVVYVVLPRPVKTGLELDLVVYVGPASLSMHRTDRVRELIPIMLNPSWPRYDIYDLDDKRWSQLAWRTGVRGRPS